LIVIAGMQRNREERKERRGKEEKRVSMTASNGMKGNKEKSTHDRASSRRSGVREAEGSSS